MPKKKRSILESVKEQASAIVVSVGSEAKKYLGVAVQFIREVPNWVRTRPSALKQWFREDRKKKKYHSFKLQKKIQPNYPPLPSLSQLVRQTVTFLWQNRTLFGSIMLVYGVLYVVIVRTPFLTDAKTIVSTIQAVMGETESTTLKGNIATLGAVLSTSSTGQNAVSVSIATLLMSLVYIWAIRQLHGGQKIRARDAFFQSMTPLASVVVILVVMSIQLMPFGIASFVYSTARGNNLFITGFEDMAFFAITLLAGILSFYWVSSTMVAMYASTLPGVYPVQAMVYARKLVQFRRFTVFRRFIALPILLVILYITLLLLVIRFIPNYTLYATEFFQIISLPLIHVYLYKLYRALI